MDLTLTNEVLRLLIQTPTDIKHAEQSDSVNFPALQAATQAVFIIPDATPAGSQRRPY